MKSSGETRIRILVRGRVQGVFFRASTVEVGTGLGLAGRVRNLPDGGVEVLAEGPRPALEELAAWARRGPAGARVDSVEVEWGAGPGGYAGFGIAGRWDR
ncbi:MAG TPA: acylphosphatase [bacterium]|nr:acylphosphatase [bacterium]HPJ72533.1 acylphosphatase [bacterium]HPQ65873.1 acylphosphatase [bacterium]